MSRVLADLRHGIRLLARRPGFALVAVLTLALGIGASSGIFTVLDAVLLRPLPYGNPESVVVIWSRWTGFERTWLSEAEVLDYRREATSLAAIGAWSGDAVNLTGGGVDPERVGAAFVEADLFRALGVSPALGRMFQREEELPGRDRVAVIGHGLWQRRFAGDPAILRRRIEVDGLSRQIVGVMPPGFALPLDFRETDPSEIWMPLHIDPATAERSSHGLNAAGRLRPGATAVQATAELRSITARRVDEGLYPRSMRFEAFASPVGDEVFGEVRPALLLLFGAVGALLLIACVNVANLLLVRADERRREIAVRLAMGAAAGDLLRHLLAEAAVLAGLGSAAALALVAVGIRLVASWPLPAVPRLSTLSLDPRLLAFTALLTVGITVVFSLVPAAHARRLGVVDALKDSGTGTPAAVRLRARRVLVAGQMAAAVLLLVLAALMGRSLGALERIDPGFRPDGVLTMRLSLPESTYASPERVVAFYDRVCREVRSLPGVFAAGAVRSLPLANPIGDWGLQIEGYAPPPGTQGKGDWQVATPGYFEAIGERLIRGRLFTDADTADAPPVALVNETMARTYWPGQDPIGRRIRQGVRSNRPWITVVGVVGDVRHNGINTVIKEKFYRPHAQFHAATGNPVRQMTLVLKASGDPGDLAAPVREAVRRIDPNVPVAAVRTMDEVVGATIAAPRLAGWVLGLFAVLAIALAAVGVYGVLSYLVAQRTREFGIRAALGAGPRAILLHVLAHGLAPCAIGIALGVAGAFGAARLIASQLYGVRPDDRITFVAVPALLFVVAAVASYVPARRATRADPLACLRSE